MAGSPKPRRRRKSGEVVTIDGSPLTCVGTLDPDLIRHAEWLLERVRAGEVVSATTAFVYADGASGYSSKSMLGPQHRRIALIGQLSVAMAELAAQD